MTLVRLPDSSRPHTVFTGQSMCWTYDPWPEPTDLRNIELGMMTCHPIGMRWRTIAIPGHGWKKLMAIDEFMSGLATQPRRDRLDIIVMNGGQSDVGAVTYGGSSLTGEEAYDRATEMSTRLRSMGYDKIVGVTWPAVDPNLLEDPTEEQWDIAVNLYRDDPEGAFDAIALAHLVLHDNTDPILYNPDDHGHLTVAGTNVLADTIRPVIVDLLDP